MTDFLRDLSRNPEWVLPESIVDWTAPGMKTPRKVTPYWLKSEAQALRRRAQAMPDSEQRARAKEIADGMDVLADDALGAIRGVPKDFRQMPDSPRYGDLRGLVVRKEIHDDIVGASGVWVGEKGAYDKTFDKLGTFNAFWKMMKVPFNPPTQIRNMVSNGVLLDLSGVPAQHLPLLYVRAFNEIRKNGKFYRIAVKHGIPASTFTAAELYRIRPDLLRVRGEKGGVVGRLAKMAEPLARLAKKPGDLYQFKVFPSMPQRVIRGVNLTLQQYDEFVQLAGRPAKDLLGRIIASPKYAALSDFGKAKAIRQIISETRETARKAFLAMHPDFLRRTVRRRVDLITAP